MHVPFLSLDAIVARRKLEFFVLFSIQIVVYHLTDCERFLWTTIGFDSIEENVRNSNFYKSSRHILESFLRTFWDHCNLSHKKGKLNYKENEVFSFIQLGLVSARFI